MFSGEGVDDRLLETVLEAANMAPSAHNRQSWRFIVLRGKKKNDMASLVSAAAPDFPRPSSVLLRMAARTVLSAPAVIAVTNTGELIEHGTELFTEDKAQAYDFFRTMEIQSSAAAVQNLLLAATSLGLGTVWLGILFLIKKEVLAFLGEPQGEFMAVVPVGRPLKEPAAGPRKLPLGAVIKHLED
jgi:nitroreductase